MLLLHHHGNLGCYQKISISWPYHEAERMKIVTCVVAVVKQMFTDAILSDMIAGQVLFLNNKVIKKWIVQRVADISH